MKKPQTIVDILRSARALLRRGNSWTKGSYARTAHDRRVLLTSRNACKFCAAGAVYRVGGGLGRVLADRAIQHLHRAVGKKHERCVFTFNDAPTTRKRDVLALFDRVIAKVAA